MDDGTLKIKITKNILIDYHSIMTTTTCWI